MKHNCGWIVRVYKAAAWDQLEAQMGLGIGDGIEVAIGIEENAGHHSLLMQIETGTMRV